MDGGDGGDGKGEGEEKEGISRPRIEKGMGDWKNPILTRLLVIHIAVVPRPTLLPAPIGSAARGGILT